MVFTVSWRGQIAGTVNITEQGNQVAFEVCCISDTREILRCYGQNKSGGKPLLIGVLEPQGGALWAKRVFTKQSLKDACGETPDTYYIYANGESEQGRQPVKMQTGDALLDAALAGGLITSEKTQNGFRISCPFDAKKPFPLVFAAVACRIEKQNGEYVAVLEI